jgi:hypothetical protein
MKKRKNSANGALFMQKNPIFSFGLSSFEVRNAKWESCYCKTNAACAYCIFNPLRSTGSQSRHDSSTKDGMAKIERSRLLEDMKENSSINCLCLFFLEHTTHTKGSKYMWALLTSGYLTSSIRDPLASLKNGTLHAMIIHLHCLSIATERE